MRQLIERRLLAALDTVSNASGKAVDSLYATLVHRLGLTAPFFKAGWGDLKVVDFQEEAELLHSWPPAHFDVQIQWRKVREGRKWGRAFELLQGEFRTPCQGKLWDALPPESRTTHVQLLRPKAAEQQTGLVIHLAGTGDHGFQRRMRMGAPLLEQGVATLVLESPFYGRRRPAWQPGSRLLRVSDLLVLGRATIEEGLCLLTWAGRQGAPKLGVSGFSMGGVHAGMVAGLFPAPIACTPLLAPRSASVAFCDGVLWDATAWRPLASPRDERERDVLATVREAAQPSALTAAASRVLRRFQRRQELQPSSPEPQPAPAAAAAAAEAELLQAAAADQPSQAAASSSYGAAAAFLGFRLPGWQGSKGSGRGIGAAEQQLSRLQSDDSQQQQRQQQQGGGSGGGGGLDRQQARARLEQVLETYTDVTRFPCPKQPSAAVIVGALEDAYVTRESIRELSSHWPGSEVRWVPGGHVSAFLLQQPAFRSAILDSLARLRPADA